MKPTQSMTPKSYVFQVEVLVEGSSNGAALEKIIHALNEAPLLDYRILSGIQLGQLIDERKSEAVNLVPIDISEPVRPENAIDSSSAPEQSDGFDSIRKYMKSNKLIRLIVNKGFGVKLSIPCRIINFDDQTSVVTIYHVDEKQVYTFRLNEIEDFQE
ncbi:hypothetical protein [Paenibacillus radicis (ex Gao et al. 2016)]|uniref:Uncharacterized protein n=1 Tax=Paenibacillus radicis (ex Gao et al. 2016) TaxID=1737354 RepID=A0A917M2H3_9BACL|nr:hypothetical protein [Paenibacillus radicis (ex Gao et al. 2016)]GGG75030.1 hypothetical protein GCM10010918_34030 [Paenibacillus radicis (ex Gao et al. 2016)]